MFELKGKKILLIGATGILGREYAKVLASLGTELILCDLESTDVDELARSLGAAAVHIDLSSEENIVNAIAQTGKHADYFDAVVNNAAITGEALQRAGAAFAPFEEYPTELWKLAIDVNLTGTFIVARESSRFLKKSTSPSLITVSSIYGIHGPDHRIYEGERFRSFAAYSASKAGIIGLTKWLATYWGEAGIRVNCLVPGGVENGQSKAFVQKYSDRIPLNRMAKPNDMSGALVYLLSDESRYITGGVLEIDGGLSAW